MTDVKHKSLGGVEHYGSSKVPNDVLMCQLSAEHSRIKELIGDAPVNYVGMPLHGNIGDLLIMLGTLTFFEKYNVNVKIKSAMFNFSPSWVAPGDVVVFHGGGNFGDLYYRGHQQIRERLICSLKNNRIVILPQTIYFKSESAYEKCYKIMSSHPDLHICVRDRRSFALAEKITKNVYLLPDMAHQLWPISRRENSKDAVLGLIRTDSEIGSRISVHLDRCTDWPELVAGRAIWIKQLHTVMRILHLFGMDRSLVKHEMNLWVFCSKRLVSEAIKLFSGYNAIVTDRLHGHILACLMAIPNYVFDNSYGKNRAYVRDWTFTSEIVTTHEADVGGQP
jgi:pyruvyl transferase EpsO